MEAAPYGRRGWQGDLNQTPSPTSAHFGLPSLRCWLTTTPSPSPSPSRRQPRGRRKETRENPRDSLNLTDKKPIVISLLPSILSPTWISPPCQDGAPMCAQRTISPARMAGRPPTSSTPTSHPMIHTSMATPLLLMASPDPSSPRTAPTSPIHRLTSAAGPTLPPAVPMATRPPLICTNRGPSSSRRRSRRVISGPTSMA